MTIFRKISYEYNDGCTAGTESSTFFDEGDGFPKMSHVLSSLNCFDADDFASAIVHGELCENTERDPDLVELVAACEKYISAKSLGPEEID